MEGKMKDLFKLSVIFWVTLVILPFRKSIPTTIGIGKQA